MEIRKLDENTGKSGEQDTPEDQDEDAWRDLVSGPNSRHGQ